MVSFYAYQYSFLVLQASRIFLYFQWEELFSPPSHSPYRKYKKSMLTVSVLVSCHVIKNQEIVFTKGSKSRMESDCLIRFQQYCFKF